MYYCHKEKLIHRDLKLENLLLANKEDKLLKIVDFGIAGLSSNFTLDDVEAGSLTYLAPEVFLGKPEFITPAVDI